jgi:hypothetical protein
MSEMRVLRSLITDARAEDLWQVRNEIRVAAREFRRSRRYAHIRLIQSALGRGRIGKTGTEARGELDIALGDVSGIVDECGRLRLGVPPMPRGLANAWQSEYYRIGLVGGEEPFALRLDAGAWYLEGGWRALLRLEMLRMRGEPTLRAHAVVGNAQEEESIELRNEGCFEDCRRSIAC